MTAARACEFLRIGEVANTAVDALFESTRQPFFNDWLTRALSVITVAG